MKYYSTQRPITPGSFPTPAGNAVVEIVNFDSPAECKEIGRKAWGRIEYERPLSEDEAKRWELTPEGTLWYPVTVSSRKHGGGLWASSGDAVRSVQRPEDAKGDTKETEFKTRYFSSREESQRVRNVIRGLNITTERVRQSVTQGEVRVFINGEYILNFGDSIVLVPKDSSAEDYYGDNIGGWRSGTPDSAFVLGLIWHPFDYNYHYSGMVCRKLGIQPEQWIAVCRIRDVCSSLYARAIRIGREMGYRRFLTYTLPAESGSSLRAVGFQPDGIVKSTGSGWDSPSRPRNTKQYPAGDKLRWVFYAS